jgi:hypothetical protein
VSVLPPEAICSRRAAAACAPGTASTVCRTVAALADAPPPSAVRSARSDSISALSCWKRCWWRASI